MGENIQCPVCTLFLHAGMDLSVHLETHPKEQVIKALVQLTVCKGNDEAVSALSSALKVENDKNAKVESSEAAVPLNFTTNFAQNRSQKSTLHASSSSSSSATESNNSVVDAVTQNAAACREVDANDGLKHTANAYQHMDTFGNRFQQLQQQQQVQPEQQHSPLPTSQQQKQPAVFSHETNQLQQEQEQQQQQEQPTAHVGNNDFSLSAHRSVLPPPPPPPPVPPANSTALPAATTTQSTHMFAALQQQQQQTNQQHALLTQQQQNVKIVYSPILPAPQLQLYSYQAAAHNTTHQKPPPAYVTAISQIRSQNNNHNKQFQQQQLQNAAMASTPPSPPQQQQQQLHRQQQQELQPINVRALAATNTKQTIYSDQQQSNATPPPPATPTTSSQTTIVMNSTDAATHYQQLNEQVNLPHYHTQLTQEQHEQQQYHAFNYKVPTTNIVQQMGNGMTTTTTTTTAGSSFNADATNNVAKTFPAPVRPLSRPQSAYTPTFRQTNSPYPFTTPSPAPSVLRYAESPVAHYLERDNGDFIVQEIPKHIVECVETDNGEFSIVERIYQSPPSVLHIHDENETEQQQIEEQTAKSAAEVEKQTAAEHETELNTSNVEEEAKEITNKTDKADVNEDEFMSISTDTDLESDDDLSVHSKSSCRSQKKNTKTAKCNKNNIDDVLKSVNGLNACNIASGTIKGKKSSKNSITVLSDVQLNLNEYLDLVGNIIASTKINGSKAFCGNIELPGVKVEKEEPYDDYEYEQLSQHEEATNTNDKSEEIAELTTTKRIKNNNNKNSRKTDEATYEHLTLLNSNASPMNMNTNNETEESDQSLHLVNNKTDECKENYAETSVIRMAITSQKQQEHQQQQQQQQHLKCAVIESESMEKYVAEDLSKTQMKQQMKIQKLEQNNGIEQKSDFEQISPPNSNATKATQKKGPKKLIIKPKSLKTEQKSSTTTTTTTIEDEVPTTSAAAVAAAQLQKCQETSNSSATDLVVVKHEELSQQNVTESEQLEDCKPEVTKLHTEFARNDNELKMAKSLKEEDKSILNVAAEDARMLLEFAHSKKHKAANQQNTNTISTTVESGSNFLSNISLFSNKMPNIECTTSRPISSNSLRCDDEFLPLDADANQALSFAATSQEANDALAHNNEQHTFLQQQQQHTFADYPFSFLYGAGGNTHITQQHSTEMSRLGNFSPGIYHQQQTNDGNGTTAATLASTSNSLAASLDDSCSTHHQQQHHFTASHWYQQQAVANADFETALAVDCNNTAVSLPDNEGTKYLDLDFCKRESSNSFAAAGTQPAALNSSATSSSFAAATDSSLAGGDALNIRSDEKMPAKGEISEQESNCDVENSWSQPIYNDFPGRYFKTTFPSVFQQENGWHQDEYFSVQDLSAAAQTAAASTSDNQQGKTQKSFDFRLPFEASTATTAANLQLFSQINNGSNNNNNNNNKNNENKDHIDLTANTASTSEATKKKRKRASTNAQAKRSRPTATVTSQQLLLQQQQQQQQLLPFQLQMPTDSAALLAGPSTAAAAVAAMQQQQQQQEQLQQSQIKQRKRVYQCDNCGMQFNKLKDRNSHLILMHNYIRQNRRLICVQALERSSTSREAMSEVMSAHAAGASSSSDNMRHATATDTVEDSKQGIVKVEMSEPQQFEQPATDSLDKTATQAEENMLEAKTEFPEDKDLLALVPFKNEAGMVISKKIIKSRILPLAATTPASKLATLYRMLVSYNMATLRRNQNLSECEEKLMESSIFFCYVCRCNFNTVKLYDAHLTEHPAECFTCGKKFQRWKNFSLHLKRHLGWKEFGCNVCDKKFVVRSALVEHMRMHTGHTPLKCKICGKNFKRYSNLTQHRKRHVRQIVRKKEYVCHCGEVLPSKARFLWHKETHDAKPKCCPYCCDRFVHANSLRRHIRLAHSDKFDYTEPMECPMCKQIFAKSSIKAHMATHSMDTQYNCAICNKSFSTKWNLKIHNWVHANRTAKPFKCEHCPKAFVREIDIKNHINAHKQIKPYTCEFCGCKFIRKYNYMRHRKEHHGNKKYTCDLCKKSFHRHYYLIEHRRIHTGERPFTCTICGKSSTTKTNHNKHLKIHHSRDPFTVEA